MFDWLGDILSGMGDALSVVFEGLGADIAVDIWNALVEWIYTTIFDAVADLFTSMNNMGAEIFTLGWVNAVVRLFTLFGWALFAVGVAGAVFEVAIEAQTGKTSIQGAAINILKGFFACALVGVVPVELYKFCVSLQNSFAGDLTRIFAGAQGSTIGEIGGFVLSSVFSPPGSSEPFLKMLFFLLAFSYCAIKVFFANIKRGGILLIQIAVKNLYEQYAQGASMRELLASMQQTGVTYGEGMPWNLNRISRLLSDGRYVGSGSYPTIITQEVFETVTQKKEKKAPDVQVTQAYKVLRQKCGKKITVHIQQEVLYLLNTLAGRPDRIKKPLVPISKNQRLLLLQSELEEIMQELPVDEERATKKLMEIAQVLYENIHPREYETRRLQRIFGKEECNPELDADLIAATVEEILVDGNDRVRLRLKNDQILERGK